MVAGSLASMAPATAAPPTSLLFYESTETTCGLETEFGFVEFVVGTETLFGVTEPYAALWVYDESVEEPVIEYEPVFVEFGEGAFEAELELFETDGWSSVGTAEAAGTYVQAGDFEVIFDGRFKVGNRWIEQRIELAPLAVEGLLHVEVEGFAPVEYDMSECDGGIALWYGYFTNPTARVDRFGGTELFCDLEQDGWLLGLEASGDRSGGELYMEVIGPDQEYFGFTDQLSVDTGRLRLEVDLWEPGFEEPTETAVIDASLGKSEPFTIDGVWQEIRFENVVYDLIVEGTLTVPGFTFDMGECEGISNEVKRFEHPDLSRGKGKVPANDLPDGATLLTNRTNDQTRMASLEPEATCTVFDEDVPLGKTVWYTVPGTGEVVTVDTAGSDFNTVMGIYTIANDELVQEECLDNVFTESGATTSAAIEFDTIEGETYYVQVGGFGGEFGHLKVAVN
jgi:hypothetical protein